MSVPAGWRRALGWRPALALALLAYLLTGVVFVGPDQQGVLVVLGRAREPSLAPGLHWTWPPPIARVLEIRLRETRRLTVGFEAPEQILGRDAATSRAGILTGDRNILLVRLAVQYAIRDIHPFLFGHRDVEQTIRLAVESSLLEVAAGVAVDDLLTTEKIALQQRIQRLGQERLDLYASGVSILGVNFEQAAPPAEVRDAFNDVASAREDRSRIVREAESHANQVLPLARGEAARLRSEADGHRRRVVDRGRGESARFEALAEEFRLRPAGTRERLYLETLEEALPRVELTILEPGAEAVDLDFVRPTPASGTADP